MHCRVGFGSKQVVEAAWQNTGNSMASGGKSNCLHKPPGCAAPPAPLASACGDGIMGWEGFPSPSRRP
jgi:hypothetical protein